MLERLKTVPIYYRPEQTANNATSYSPSATKPAAVVASWQALGVPLDIRNPHQGIGDDRVLPALNPAVALARPEHRPRINVQVTLAGVLKNLRLSGAVK